MASIIVRIDSMKLDHTDANFENRVVRKIEQQTSEKIVGDGFDYMGHTDLGIFLKTEDPSEQIPKLIGILEENRFDGNSLKGCFKVLVANDGRGETAPMDYRQVYPQENHGLKADFWKKMFSK
ncbi:MAG: hypothetical protein ACI4PQ_01855 [Butyricicoccaceae bacterium]